MRTGYAYFDKYGILHVSVDKAIAEKSASGKVVPTTLPFSGGYLVNTDNEAIFVYERGEGSSYIGGNRRKGKEFNLADMPEVKKLIDELNS